MKHTFSLGDTEVSAEIQREGDALIVTVGEDVVRVTGAATSPGILHLSIDGRPTRVITAAAGGVRHLAVGDVRLAAARVGRGGRRARRHEEVGNLTSPMPGQVLKVLAAVGDKVDKGATLMIIEAMKMEHAIRAPHAGTVTGVHFSEGDMVTPGAALAEVTPE